MLFKNSKGMTARVFALAATNDKNRHILLASWIGALTEVKAIWATILNNRSHVLTIPRYRRYNVNPDLQYRLIKSRLARGFHHWTLFALPMPEAPFLLLLDDGHDLPTRLVELLNTHTLWPVLPEWGEVLWQQGSSAGRSCPLIIPCDCQGPGIAHAYAVHTDGWDGLLDKLAQEGSILFRKE